MGVWENIKEAGKSITHAVSKMSGSDIWYALKGSAVVGCLIGFGVGMILGYAALGLVLGLAIAPLTLGVVLVSCAFISEYLKENERNKLNNTQNQDPKTSAVKIPNNKNPQIPKLKSQTIKTRKY